MHALDRLAELHLVAEQDEVAGARAHRDQVRDGDLAGLVDEEVVERLVELGAREEPRRAGDELEIAGRHVLVRLDVLDERAVEASVFVPVDLLHAAEARRPASFATSSTFASRLLIALWLFDDTPTRLPRFSSSTMTCAPV